MSRAVIAEVEDVTLRIDADGAELKVRIAALGANESAPFHLSPNAWRDLYGVPLDQDSPRRKGAKGRPEGTNPLLTRSPGASRYRPLIPVEVQVERSPQQLGAELFRALFPTPILSVYGSARGRADRLRLRLQLDLSDSRTRLLHRLPWELLYDPKGSGFLLLDRRLTLMRHCLGPEAARPAAAAGRLRVLPVASNPRGGTPLALGEEEEDLRRVCGGDSLIEILHRPEQADLLKIRRRLLDDGAQILHFMGHGDIGEDGQGRLIFETPSGEAEPVHGGAVASALGDLPELRLIVLNACRGAEIRSEPFSGVATALVRKGIPAVVAMQSPISDQGARAFSHELYRRLARGEDLDLALCEARHALCIEDPESPEWATPVLFSASSNRLIRSADHRIENASENPDESDLKQRYLSYLAEKLDGVETSWLPPSSPLRRLRLRAVYSKLRPSQRSDRDHGASRSLKGSFGVGDLTTGAFGRNHTDEPTKLCSWSQILDQEERLVVVGESGSGKSHLVRHTAQAWAQALAAIGGDTETGEEWAAGQAREVPAPRIPRLPILLQANRFAAACRKRPGLRLSEYLGRHLGPDCETPVADVSGCCLEPSNLNRLLLRELMNGGACLLVDGLEVIADPTERWQVAEEIHTFLRFVSSSANGRDSTRACRVILSCQPGSELLEGMDEGIRVFELRPLDEEGLSKLCEDLEHAAGSVHLRSELLILNGLEQQRRGFWPSEVVLFAHFLSPFEGRLPRRLTEVAEALSESLYEGWESPSEKEPSNGDDCWERWRLLPELAAAAMDEAPWGQADAQWVLRWLGERFPGRPSAELEQKFLRNLGPLVSMRNDFRVLHRLLQDMLGALWLVSDPGKAGQRLLAHCDQPRWRRPVAIGLGLLSKSVSGGELAELISEIAGEENPAALTSPSHDLPARSFVLIQALDELVEPPPPVVELIISRLLHCASSPLPPLQQACQQMLLARLRGPHGPLVMRSVGKALEVGVSAAAVVAELASEVQLSPRLAEILEANRGRDRVPWPLEQALRKLSQADPVLLSAPRFSLRRAVAREQALASELEANPDWRRLILLLFGGRPDNPILFPSNPQLERQLVQAIKAGDSPGEALGALTTCKGSARDGSPSLHPFQRLAMKTSAPETTASGYGSPRDRIAMALALNRALVGLPEEVRLDEEVLKGLLRVAEGLPPRVWSAALLAALPHIASQDRVSLLIDLAERLPPDRRSPVLGSLLRELSSNVLEADAEGEAEHRLAVFLDTRGALLTEPAHFFVDTCLAIADPYLPAPLALGNSDLAPERLAAALDSLLTLPDFLAPVQALALSVLAPRLIVAGFSLEGEILAELAVPERLGLRSMVRNAFGIPSTGTSDDELDARAKVIADPWRRFRALRRLALHRFSCRRAHGLALPGGGLVLPSLEAAAYSIPAPYLRSLAFEALACDAPPGHRTAWALESAAARMEIAETELRPRLGLRLLALDLHPEPVALFRQVHREIETIADHEVRADLLDRLRRLAPRDLSSNLEREETSWGSDDLRAMAEGYHAELLLRHLGDAGAGGDLLAARALAADLDPPVQKGSTAPPGLAGILLPRLDGDLASTDPERRRLACLERAEAGELDPSTFGTLLELVDAPNDHLRLRAALALHGAGGERLPWRSAARLDPEVLFSMARRWRNLRQQSPRRAVIIRWTFATIRHDSPELLASLALQAAEEGPRSKDAETVLRLIETLDGRVVPEVARSLREGPLQARRALVLGLVTVLGRGRSLDLLWPSLAGALPAAAEAFDDERISLQGPMAMIEAAEKAWRRLGCYGAETAEWAQNRMDEGTRGWVELLRLPPEELLSNLVRLGRRQFFGQSSQTEVREAAERAVEQPELLPLLLDWAEQRWRQDLQALAPGDHEASDLLRLVARIAARLPLRYLEATQTRPLWGRLLRDAAVESDRFGARIAALELLALRRNLDAGALEGLLAAVGDVPEVEASAFAALDLFHTLDDPDLLSPLEAALMGPSAATAYLAGRLMARIASRPRARQELTDRVDSALANAAGLERQNHDVFLATVESRFSGRILGIENKGPLGHLLYGLRLKLHRVEEMLRDLERESSEVAI